MPTWFSAYGTITVVTAALIFVALLVGCVKLRFIFQRLLGVRVYDFGADFRLPPTAHSRGYLFALYLTMKSMPPTRKDAPTGVKTPAASP